VKIDERTLREVYLPHFKTSSMPGGHRHSAYNRVNGYTAEKTAIVERYSERNGALTVL
jgi:hypothetical protein